MNMLKKLGITPGLWAVDHGVTFPGVNVVAGDKWICEVGQAKNPGVLEDARLIVAAPEMLEALIDMLEDCCFICRILNPQRKDCPECNDVLPWREVVEKATGKTWEEIKEMIK